MQKIIQHKLENKPLTNTIPIQTIQEQVDHRKHIQNIRKQLQDKNNKQKPRIQNIQLHVHRTSIQPMEDNKHNTKHKYKQKNNKKHNNSKSIHKTTNQHTNKKRKNRINLISFYLYQLVL